MVPAALLREVMAWGSVLGVVLVLGSGAAVLWSPVLASTRVRALFRELPLSNWTVVNYVVTAITLSIPWVFGVAWAFHRLEATQVTDGAVFLNVSTLLTVTYVVLIPLGACCGLPRIGIDWDPSGYSVSTWLLLVVGSLWYSAIFTIPMFLIGIIISMPT